MEFGVFDKCRGILRKVVGREGRYFIEVIIWENRVKIYIKNYIKKC